MNKSRRQLALDVRTSAAQMAADREHPTHNSNGDEQNSATTSQKSLHPTT